MSGPTPTTEEVRDYIRTADRVTAHMFAAGADTVEAFDRWLAAHDDEVRASVVPEIGMPCANTKPHPAHAWQMSATGWCLCVGVVAEEPEWEYGVRLHPDNQYKPNENRAIYTPPTTPHSSLERAREMAALNPRYRPSYHRRRKAGPWVPVKQEGAGIDG